MPIYEYDCQHCGGFTELRSIPERDMPAACPVCREEGKRVIHSAPGTTLLGAHARFAHETNERSRHEPRTLDQHRARAHGAGCSCCSVSRKPASQSKSVLKTAGSRPWMISH